PGAALAGIPGSGAILAEQHSIIIPILKPYGYSSRIRQTPDKASTVTATCKSCPLAA
ncbi:MAG: hypothetical protein RJA72_1117, partial [Pseudomonadota bacterium]